MQNWGHFGKNNLNIFEILKIQEHIQSSYNTMCGFGKISQLPNSVRVLKFKTFFRKIIHFEKQVKAENLTTMPWFV